MRKIKTVRILIAGFQALDKGCRYHDSMFEMHSLISSQDKHLVSDLLRIAREKVKRRGRRLSDLRFAKRTINGYAFFEVGHEVWDMLHDIVMDTYLQYRHYSFAFITELCSEIVNMDEEELSSLAI